MADIKDNIAAEIKTDLAYKRKYMSIDKHKPVRARSQSFRSLKDQNENRSKTNLQIPLIFSFEKDLPEHASDNLKKRSASSNP